MTQLSPRIVRRALSIVRPMIAARSRSVPGLRALALGAVLTSIPIQAARAMPPLTVDVGPVERHSVTLRVRSRGPSEVAMQVYRRARIPGSRQPRLRVYGRPQVMFFDRYTVSPAGGERAVVVEGLSPDGVYYYRAWTPQGFVVRGRFGTPR